MYFPSLVTKVSQPLLSVPRDALPHQAWRPFKSWTACIKVPKRPKWHTQKTRWDRLGHREGSWNMIDLRLPSRLISDTQQLRAEKDGRSLLEIKTEKYWVASNGNRTWSSRLEIQRSTDWATQDFVMRWVFEELVDRDEIILYQPRHRMN